MSEVAVSGAIEARVFWKRQSEGWCQVFNDVECETPAELPRLIAELVENYRQSGCEWPDPDPVSRVQVREDGIWKDISLQQRASV